jgi:hypothetical protein
MRRNGDDLDERIALATSIMRENGRCGAVRLIGASKAEGGFDLSTITDAEICSRVKNHSGEHKMESVKTTIPFDTKWRPSDHA